MHQLLPKEHGAYGQVAFPALTALAVAGPSIPGLAIGAAVVAGFLAHEPAAILLGWRGSRARREWWRPAMGMLAATLLVAVSATVATVLTMDPVWRWSIAMPIVPALVLVLIVARGHEKSAAGQLAAAVSFAGIAVPVTVAADAPLHVALAVSVPFALLFTTSVLAVRTVTLAARRTGSTRAASRSRRATFVLTIGAATLIGAATRLGWLTPPVLLASLPGLLTTLAIAVRPPSASRLRSVGWTLMAMTVATAVLIVTTVGG